MTRRVAITGRGAVSGYGTGLEALRAGMRAGRSAIRPVRRFATEGLDSHLAALVPGFDSPQMPEQPSARTLELAVEWAVRAGREALADRPETAIGLVLGSNLEDRPHGLGELLTRVGDGLDVQGPRLLVSTACSSSTAAFQPALDWLRTGAVGAVLVGGTDCISPRLMAGFHVLGVLAAEACTPFGSRTGLSLGEGAGFVLLEPLAAARARGARVWAELVGAGSAADAHDLTRPVADGAGVRAALEAALADGAVPAEAVVHVHAHGTGTEANDAAEARGIAAAVGAHVPASSSKHLLGHAQGAAGILELLLTLLAAEEGAVPGTWGLDLPRPGAPLDPVPEGLRPAGDGPRLSVNSGFGGSNAAVLLGEACPARPRRPVYVREPAWIGPGALDAPRGALDPAALARWERRVDPRHADPSTLALIGAARRAARQLRGVRGVGLCVGQLRGSEAQVAELGRSIDAHGLRRLKGSAFARSLLVAPAGMASAELGLRGPLLVLCAGAASGLAAFAHAAERVAAGSAGMVAASTDEVVLGGPRFAGAVAVPLCAEPGPVCLGGWAIAAEDAAVGADFEGERVRVDADGAASEGLLALVRAFGLAASGTPAVVAVRAPGHLSIAVSLVPA